MYSSLTKEGVVHRIDTERNQIWIKPDSGFGGKNHIANNTVTTTINDVACKFTIELNTLPEESTVGVGRLQLLGCTNAWTAAWQAPYYYKGTNDTRLSIYDALSTGATSNPYTYAEWLEDQNEELTAIRTVKPEYISQFVEVYKEYVNS